VELSDSRMEVYSIGGVWVPVVKQTTETGPPKIHVIIEGQGYNYDRSYPVKGHSALMPPYLREQLNAGKQPLLIERPERFYVYIAEAAAKPAAAEAK
jgi:hypothetical protein